MHKLISCFVYLALFSNSVLAQELPDRLKSDRDSVFSITHENDFFAGEDDGYTSGVRMSWLSSEVRTPKWIKGIVNAVPTMAKKSQCTNHTYNMLELTDI